MAGEMSFSMADLYPNYSQVDTSTVVVPEPDDQDALGEEVTAAEATKPFYARGKNMIYAAIVLIGLIVFFGGVK